MPSWTWIILWVMLLPQNNHRCKYFSSHRWNSACLWSIFIMINGNLLFSSHTVGINKPSFIWKLFFSNRSIRISDIHVSLQWPHNDHDGVSNHQPHGCLFSHLFRRRSKKTSNLRVTGLCAGNSLVTGEIFRCIPKMQVIVVDESLLSFNGYMTKDTAISKSLSFQII